MTHLRQLMAALRFFYVQVLKRGCSIAADIT